MKILGYAKPSMHKTPIFGHNLSYFRKDGHVKIVISISYNIEQAQIETVEMVNIAIIGAGQIGSRHLQAMVNLESAAKVQLVDPSEESLRIAKERFFQVYQEHSKRIELKCHSSIDDLCGPIDLAIVATCSDVRAGVVKELTRKKEVKNLVLEKVLFQTVAEYFETDDLLRKKDIPTWVNCWMREKDFYKKLKTQLNLDEKIQMGVEGSLWGMGCNSIHFIDLFSYITERKDFNFVECHLDKKSVESKRLGFKEFSGKLMGTNSKGHSLSLVCCNKGNHSYRIQVINGPQKHEITDCVNHVVHRFFDGEEESIENVEIPFQSQTTHRLVHKIINEKKCDLPSYHDSMNLHLPLIKVLIEHLQNITGDKVERCPIT